MTDEMESKRNANGATDGDADAATDDDTVERRGGEHLCEALADAGISLCVGLPGTQTLALDRAIAGREDLRYVMARHETAVPHVAWGYFEACGRPAATVTVPGPGETNAMHGLKNAAEDSVPIVHVSADSNPDERGRGPIHELDPATFEDVVKANLTVERRVDFPRKVASAIETALTPPYGPVRLGVPSGLLRDRFRASPVSASSEHASHDHADEYARAADLLATADRPLLVVGGGCRRTDEGPRIVTVLAEALDAPVLATLKGKGVYAEDGPRFLGVAGSHLPADARSVLERADVALALGTDFDGVTTDHWDLPMGDRLVHVGLAPEDIGRSYDTDVAIVKDIRDAGDALLGELGSRTIARGWDGASIGGRVRGAYEDHLRDRGLLDGNEPANTPALLGALREAIPAEATVTTDIGGFRLWTMQAFEAHAPERFVTAGSWAGMGIGLPAAVGAALARPDAPAVALTGDGGLLMCIHELHTAAEHDLDVTVVVSDNADYGIISKSPELASHDGAPRFDWESPSFVSVAEGFGCEAVQVTSASDAGDAVADGIETDGPVLVDVAVDPTEPSAPRAAEYEPTISVE